MKTQADIDTTLDLAIKTLKESPENGNSVTIPLFGAEYIIRRLSLSPFVIEVLTPTGGSRTYEETDSDASEGA